MNKSDTISSLVAALVKAQGMLKPAIKDSTNPHFRSKYADLQSVWEAARPAMQANKLALVQGFERGDGDTVTVFSTLLHESGEWISSSLTLKPSKADPQGTGSAITYARRYGLAAILGIVADEDDDGNAACADVRPEKHRPTPQVERAIYPDQSAERFEDARPVAPQAPSPNAVRSAPAGGWREFPFPKFIKKHFGKKLGDVPPDDVLWWAHNYEPKPYQGVIQPADIAFADALKRADAELNSEPVPF